MRSSGGPQAQAISVSTTELFHRRCEIFAGVDVPEQSIRNPLSRPTAARLFSLLSTTRGPLTTSELARRANLHPNSVRRHLGSLAEAGLVRRSSVSAGAGRPRHEWWVSPAGRVGGEPPGAYRELAAWLTRSIGARHISSAEIEASGEEIGREIAPATGFGDSVATLEAAFAAMGFQPRIRREDRRVAFRLTNCPYRDAAKENPGVVCALHRGIARGLVSEVEPSSRLCRFSAHDPDEARCEIEIEPAARTSAAGPTAAAATSRRTVHSDERGTRVPT